MLKNLHTVIHERGHVYIIYVCSCVSVCVVLCIYLTLFSLLFMTISCSLSCSICTCTIFIYSVYVCRYTHSLVHTAIHYYILNNNYTRYSSRIVLMVQYYLVILCNNKIIFYYLKQLYRQYSTAHQHGGHTTQAYMYDCTQLPPVVVDQTIPVHTVDQIFIFKRSSSRTRNGLSSSCFC